MTVLTNLLKNWKLMAVLGAIGAPVVVPVMFALRFPFIVEWLF